MAAAAVLAIVLPLIPRLPGLISAIRDFKKANPAMTDAQIAALVAATGAQADAAFDDVLQQIAEDQAKTAPLVMPLTPIAHEPAPAEPAPGGTT